MKRSPDLAVCLAASLALAAALAVPCAGAAGSAAATEATRASATGNAPAVPMAPPEVPPALQEVRRHMLDADVNALTFHEMDQIFDTRRVPAGTSTWMLPRAPAKMDFSYEFGGK